MESDRSSDHQSATPSAEGEDQFATTRESAETSVPMRLLLKSAGTRPVSFGRYEIQRVLGEGAMGSVYLARDTQLQRQVAIKVPKLDAGDRDGLHRFHREARTMATLRHPHLCPVFDVGEIGGVHFLTMAFIEGGTLVDYLTEGEGLPDRQVARLIAKTAAALDAAHKAGIVHRDLKPANIMIDRNKEPVVTDFGLAAVADANASLTQWGQMLGTPAYMAPEQIRGDLDLVGPASDVYSLGAIMYQMLTGSIPFAGSVASVLRKALDSEPAELVSLSKHIDAQLSAICRKAMAKDPRERFASAAEMANALRDFLLTRNRPPTTAPAPAGLTATGPAPAAPATGAPATAAETAHLDQQTARVRELWGEARYADALPILVALARRTDQPAARYAAWARHEIPKIREKIKQAETAGDWLAAAHAATHAHLGPPAPGRRSSTSESLPPWLIWAMAAPVAVIVFLTVLVIVTGWSGSNPGPTTIATAPADPASTARPDSAATPPAANPPRATTGAAATSEVDPPSAAPSIPGEQGTAVRPAVDRSPRQPAANQPPAGNDPLSTRPAGTQPPGPHPADAEPPETQPVDPRQPPGSGFPGPGGPPPRRPPPPRDAAGLLRDLDFNQDGQLTLDEIPPQHRPHLMRADTNGDAILTRAELEAFHQRPLPPPTPR